MARKNKGFGIFISTFCISFVILSALFLLFMLYTRTAKVETVEPDVPKEHIVTAKENMTLLLLASDNITNPPELILLASYRAPQGQLSLLLLPPETVCQREGRTDTLEGWYDYEGVRGCLNSVNTLLNVDIQRYLRTDGNGLAALIDFLGGVEYEIPGDFTIGSEQFYAGRQLLDGRRLKTLLFFPDSYGAAEVARQRELTSLLAESRLNESFAGEYDRFTATLFDCCETNLSQFDFLERREGFTSHLRNHSLALSTLSLEGDYSANHTRFTPDSTSIRDIQSRLSGREPA